MTEFGFIDSIKTLFAPLPDNGFFYTMIGAACGLLLGSRLADVGGD